MPALNRPSLLASAIASAPRRHDNDYPLWQGPSGDGPLGGITQSMLVRFLSCRERFRLRYILGLEPPDKWVKTLGYGNMWHCAEEGHARQSGVSVPPAWQAHLVTHAHEEQQKYPLQREEIAKWFHVCAVQFPEYVKYWAEHPDVKNRTPLMQEQVFDVPYSLPSGRVVRLRGKFDSVDLIGDGIWLQENKTKGNIDKLQVERQLKFDLQTMMYLTALQESNHRKDDSVLPRWGSKLPILGVRYNVVRRPLSGGVANITPHKAKSTKNKYTPAETAEQFYERLRRDYIADDPAYWFFRVRAEISAQDIQVFRNTCLDPLLETVCRWYDEVTGTDSRQITLTNTLILPVYNYRTPFGVWSALEEGGATEYDVYLATGSESTLRRVDNLFTELQ